MDKWSSLNFPTRLSPEAFPSAPAFTPSLMLCAEGLVLGKGTVMAAWRNGRAELEIEGQGDAIYALLAMAALRRRTADATTRLAPVSRALACGEPALAAIALAQSGLPALANMEAAEALAVAARALDNGVALDMLLKWAGLAALEKYDPDQLRDERGRWTATGHVELAATTKNFGYACKKLDLDPNDTSDAYHALKEHRGLGGADNCVFDLESGDIFHNGDLIGNLFHL